MKSYRDADRTRRASGFTLVELLVILAIIAILCSLLIPAVVASRRAATRLQCSHHLRQVSIATNAYHDLFNCYPAYFNSGRGVRGAISGKDYSVFSRIAPQLEQINLFNSINFQLPLFDTSIQGQRPIFDQTFGCPANTTVMNHGIGVLLCPSDPSPSSQVVFLGTNYRANYGVAPNNIRNKQLSGPFTYWKATSAADVTDGLSQTVAYSEKPRGDVSRSTFNPFVDILIDPMEIDPPATTLFEYCDRQPIIPENFRTTTGVNWLVGGLTQTCYDHMDTPNGKLPDCTRLAVTPPTARSTARSYHGAGVNVAMADGSVRFVTAQIDLRTWMAIGTRAGNEVISNEW